MSAIQPKRRFVVTAVLEQTSTKKGNRFITCALHGDTGCLAVWGTPGKNMAHVDALNARMLAGFPMTIECEWIHPTDQHWVDQHSHKYWAYERHSFRILA